MGQEFDPEYYDIDPEDIDSLDSVILALGEQIIEEESKVGVLDPLKFKQIQFVYSVAKYLTKGTDCLVTYKLNEPFKSIGSVSIEGKQLLFSDPEWFSRMAEFSSNTDIYALANGNVRITFTFHNIVVPIE